MPKLRYLGHSCFVLSAHNISIIFDPFLTDNPANILKESEVDPNYILVSHAHGDHLGDGIKIAKRTGAMAISTFEVANLFAEESCTVHGMHLGGKYNFEFGSVKIIPAFHGSGVAGGHACGFVVDFFGVKVYFAGDTSLFGDMMLVSKLGIDYALLPIGDNYTMGPEDALSAVKLIHPKTVIPMHYNTWPLIAQDPEDFKTKVESFCSSKVNIMNPGDEIELSL